MRNIHQTSMLGVAIMALAALSAVSAAGAAKLSTLHHFTGGADGGNPHGKLLLENGALYGTTETGGASGAGTVFKLDPNTGSETVLYSFSGGSDGSTPTAGLISEGGIFYGTTSAGGSSGVGTVFAFDASTGTETVLHNFTGFADGDVPFGGLLYHGGLLYGTTEYGGTSGYGTVYSVDPATGAEKVLFVFGHYTGDGNTPFSDLI